MCIRDRDSVRDSYLVALTILKEKKLLAEEFQKAMETTHCLTDELNDTSEQTVTKVQTILEKMRKNSYSLETDSGKADMVTGKVVLKMCIRDSSTTSDIEYIYKR